MTSADPAALSIRFSPLMGTGPEHPSPGRVLGALLAGAYRSGRPSAVQAVRALAALEQPSISLPQRGAEFTYTAASTPNPEHGWNLVKESMVEVGSLNDTNGLGRMDVMVPSTSRSASLAPVRRDHIHGDYVFYTCDLDGTVDRDALAVAASHVTVFGGGADLALCSIGEQTPDHAPDGVWVPAGEQVRVGGRRYRIWSPALLQWYDDQHELQFGAAGAVRTSHLVDRRVAQGRWVYVRTTAVAGNSTAPRVVLAVRGRGRSQRSLPSMLAQITGEGALPMVDGRGLVRGISVLAGVGQTVELDPAASWYAQMAPELTTLDPASWQGTGEQTQRWISATPVLGYWDEHPTRWELARELQQQFGAAAKLVGVSRQPWLDRHAGAEKALPVPQGMRRWWVEVTAPSVEPLRLGRGAEQGFGLLRPLCEGSNGNWKRQS